MREGRELVGYGMATGIWEAFRMPTSARAALNPDGTLEMVVPLRISAPAPTLFSRKLLPRRSACRWIRSSSNRRFDLPVAPVEGGSWTAASAGSAVMEACIGIGKELLKRAAKIEERAAQCRRAGRRDFR